MANKSYPTIRSSGNWQTADGGFLIHHWCRIFSEHLPDQDADLSHVVMAKKMADQSTGMRSFALDVCLSRFYLKELTIEWLVPIAKTIAFAGYNFRDSDKVTKALDFLNFQWSGLADVMSWCVPQVIDEEFNYYKFQAVYPSVDLIKPPAAKQNFPLSLEEGLSKCKTRSQRDALRRIVSIADAIEWSRGQISDVELHKSALIVAPSGSGKTWLVKLASRVLNLPAHCYTVSGWSPRDSYSRHESLSIAIKQIEEAHGGCIIFIDEICKIQNQGMGGSSNYWRACQTELMQLVTGDVSDYPTTPNFHENFRKCWFIFAGAFQDLYRGQLGTSSPSAEEVERLDITLDDVIAARILPDELINRTGAFLHLAPPSIADMRSAMMQVEIAAGISVDEKERESYADEIVSRMQGFRGLENYALRIAQRANGLEKKALTAQTLDADKPKRKLPPEWF